MSWPLLDHAHHALRSVTEGLDDAAWQAPTPCAQWNVSQVFRHAIGDQHAFGSAVTGAAGPAENQFDPVPRRPADPVTDLNAALDCATAAFATVGPGTSRVPTPWPGDMTAEFVVAACSLDCVVHAWDIAVATGQASPLNAAVAEQLLASAAIYVEPLRAFYAAPLPPRAGDGAVEALLRFLGRDPDWATAAEQGMVRVRPSGTV